MVEIKTLRFGRTGEVRTSPANLNSSLAAYQASDPDNLVLNHANRFRKPEDFGGSSRSGLAPALAERTLIAAE